MNLVSSDRRVYNTLMRMSVLIAGTSEERRSKEKGEQWVKSNTAVMV